MNKNDIFIEHIKKHLYIKYGFEEEMNFKRKRHGKVMCKICCKDIDEIFKTENKCPWCGKTMMYLEQKRYFRCLHCYTDVAEDGTVLSWRPSPEKDKFFGGE